jgi:hypothetical protein
MLTETINLETLRQKIEDVEYEAGSQSDYLDYGKPNPAQVKQTRETIEKLNNQSKVLKEELRQLIATVRSQQPQALEEWVNFHIGNLQKIMDEKTTGTNAVTRRNVAKGTIQNWEKVRTGEQEYVNINWHFLKDYKANVRKLTGRAGTTTTTGNEKNGNKAWWQFWK